MTVIIFATLVYQVRYLNRIYPGVSVIGVDVGGLTQAEAATAVGVRVPDYLSRSITIETAERSWTFSGQELGIRIDIAVVVNKAYTVGRDGNFFTDILTQLRLLRQPREIEPLLWYDTGPGNQVLRQLAEQINRPPQDARLIIHSDARVEAIPAQRGRLLHLEATRALIQEALFSEQQEPVRAVTQEVLPAIPEVEAARRQAEALLSGPIVFKVKKGAEELAWQLKPEQLAGLLQVVERVDGDGSTRVAIDLDPQAFTPYFAEITQAVQQEPVEARLDFDEETDELIVVEPSQIGYALDLDAAYQQISYLLERNAHLIELPVRLTEPALASDNLEKLGIKALVSEATSYFNGSSAGRMKNIRVAASKFDGLVIPPGGVFSFNKYLGEVTAENGYDESLVIWGDRTVLDIGGGVCQVSTTAFRAAFLGGFEIVERWAHGYRVGWYEINSVPGLDATIYTPDVDFKFRNDTAYHLLIKTETDIEAGTLTFRFYGTPTNREVIVSEPEQENLIKPGPPIYEPDPSLPKGVTKQVDWEIDGLEVTITRTVKEGDKIIHEDVIRSRYRPWRAVYKVGTGA